MLDITRIAPLERAEDVLGRRRDGHPVLPRVRNALVRVPLVLRGEQNSRMHRVLTELSVDLRHRGADGRDVLALA